MKQTNAENKKCSQCNKEFNRPSAARKHEKRCGPPMICPICGKHLSTPKQFHRHINNHKRQKHIL